MFTHNMAKNFHIIFNFFPHPIRSPLLTCKCQLYKFSDMAQSNWAQMHRNQSNQLIQNRRLVFEKGKTGVTRENPLEAEQKTNKLNPHVVPSLVIRPQPQWWEKNPLTTAPALRHPCSCYHNNHYNMASDRMQQCGSA